jgi:hypothetical protein
MDGMDRMVTFQDVSVFSLIKSDFAWHSSVLRKKKVSHSERERAKYWIN